MSTQVYRIEVDFSIGGESIDASNVQIVLAPNTIPTAVVTINPIPSKRSVVVVSAGNVLSQLVELGKKIGTNETSLTVRLIPLIDGANEQVLPIRNWFLRNVGLTKLDAGGGLGVQVELKHPVCELDSGLPGLALVAGIGDDSSVLLSDSATTLIDSYARALRAWTLRQQSNGSPAATKLIARMNKLVSEFPQLLKWTDNAAVNPLPFSQLLGSGGGFHTRLMYNAIKNSGGVGSVWEHLSDVWISQYQLSICPTYTTGSLTVEPFSPWQPVSRVIEADDIANIRIPGIESSPIAGTRITYEDLSLAPPSSTYFKADTKSALSDLGVTDTELDGLSQLKEAIELTQSARGRVVSVHCPGWLQDQAASTLDDAKDAVSQEPKTGNGYYRNTDSEQDQQRRVDEAAARKSALINVCGQRLARAELLALYRQGLEVSLNTRLMLTGGSEGVIPGRRIGIKDESGTPAFSFYATGIVHNIDVAGGSAYTSWIGAYLDFEYSAASDISLKSGGEYNPLYVR